MDLRLRLYPLKILDEMHFKTPREYLMHFLGRRWMDGDLESKSVATQAEYPGKGKVSRIADLSPFPLPGRALLEEKCKTCFAVTPT